MRRGEPVDEHELPAVAPPQERQAGERVDVRAVHGDLRRGLGRSLTGPPRPPFNRTFDRAGTAPLPHPDISGESATNRRRSSRPYACRAWIPTAMRTRVAGARVGRLATRAGPSAPPALVPCCFALVDDTVYSAVDAKPKSTLALQRLANVRAHPRSRLLVDHYAEDWSTLWWVRVDGSARRRRRRDGERDAAIDALQAKYEQYRRDAATGRGARDRDRVAGEAGRTMTRDRRPTKTRGSRI